MMEQVDVISCLRWRFDHAMQCYAVSQGNLCKNMILSDFWGSISLLQVFWLRL